MEFSSLIFLYVFLPACLICYGAAAKTKYRNIVLIIFSLIFYAWGEPLFVFLLIISAIVNYFLALGIEKNAGKKRGGAWLAVTIIYDLLMLGIFKYSGFIVENLNVLLPSSMHIPVPDVRLPIGISFYTFQMISYVIDVSWGKVEAQKSFHRFLMYVLLFPQLVAGPIVRYSDIAGEIDSRKTTSADIFEGITRITVGLAKKVIIADSLYDRIIKPLFGAEDDPSLFIDISGLSVAGTWLGAAAFALRIYFDFSGYSDMAIGLGRIFGFHFDENFRHPFICRDISEFWQRWHISLSTFFRDYLLYVPIFGRRRKYGGLFLVWFCTGLWHGPSWNFVIWGLYFGLFIFIEQLIGKKRIKKIPVIIRHIYTKLVIIIGFGIFYFKDMGRLGDFFKNLVGANSNRLTDSFTELTFMNNLYLLIAAVICSLPVSVLVSKLAQKSNAVLYVTEASKAVINVGLLLICTVLLSDATNHPFLYFNF